ncbi:hypothetical protein JCM8547_007141 [Rhodosporidiobolus lusitaniae]
MAEQATPKSIPTSPVPSQPGTTNPSPSTSTSSAALPRPRMPPRGRTTAGTNAPERTRKALEGIRQFLASKSCYDILPESFRLIVFDNKLAITKSLQALVTNGVVSAPLYDSTTHRFAGMFTLADVVHLIQYYYLTAREYDNVVAEVEAFQLESLRKIEQAIDVPPPPTISVHPDQPLSDACAALVRTHARRLPLVDRDDQTGKETIVSVLTQYRVLKFIAINCTHDCARLDQSIGSLGIGSYCAWYEPPPDPSSVLPSAAPSVAPSASASPSGAPSLAASIMEEIAEPTESKLPPSVDGADGEDGKRRDPSVAQGSSTAEDKPLQEGESSGTTTRGDDTPTAPSLAPTSTSSGAAPTHPSSASDQPSLSPSAAPSSSEPAEASAHSQAEALSSNAEEDPTRSMGVSDRFWPLSTATMATSVFDVVHIFSERGISAVPIVDEDGVVLNLYETVDIVDLVRQNAYQVLDSTISDAINQRSPDFTGVMTCTPQDTLSSILAFVREKRCHRFVIVEPEDVPPIDGRPGRKKGSLVGVLSLSDVLRFLVGHENLKGMEVPGLGVHGLRGVSTVDSKTTSGTETDIDAASILETDTASSIGGNSRTTSRRGSEAQNDAGGSSVSELAAQIKQGLGLTDVVEGEAVE